LRSFLRISSGHTDGDVQKRIFANYENVLKFLLKIFLRILKR